MEINLFQLLILLFIFYPLIKRFLDGMKSRNEEQEQPETADEPWSDRQSRRQEPARPERTQSERTQSEQTRSASSERKEARGEQTWEDFFEGLEQVISGDEPKKEPTRSDSTRDSSASRQPQTAQQAAQTGTGRRRGSGSDPGYRHPSHEPVYTPSRRESASPYTYEQNSDARIGAQADEVDRELTEGENPIYKTLDDAPEVVIADDRGKKNVKRILNNPEKLRDGILLKEILDPPKSRRPHHHKF